jgi:hypothetical protein
MSNGVHISKTVSMTGASSRPESIPSQVDVHMPPAVSQYGDAAGQSNESMHSTQRPLSSHNGNPAATQSASVQHSAHCPSRHTGPSNESTHCESLLHGPHCPVDSSHTGPAVAPAQSASSWQTSHTWSAMHTGVPAGQSLLALHSTQRFSLALQTGCADGQSLALVQTHVPAASQIGASGSWQSKLLAHSTQKPRSLQ